MNNYVQSVHLSHAYKAEVFVLSLITLVTLTVGCCVPYHSSVNRLCIQLVSVVKSLNIGYSLLLYDN